MDERLLHPNLMTDCELASLIRDVSPRISRFSMISEINHFLEKLKFRKPRAEKQRRAFRIIQETCHAKATKKTEHKQQDDKL